MAVNAKIAEVTDRIIARSEGPRGNYLERMKAAQSKGPSRAHLSCSGQAHAYAATGADQSALAGGRAAHLGIVTAYNDMLSAHQPFESYPRSDPRRRARHRLHRPGRRRGARNVRRGHTG